MIRHVLPSSMARTQMVRSELRADGGMPSTPRGAGSVTPREMAAGGGLVSPRLHESFMRGWMRDMDDGDGHAEQLLAMWREKSASAHPRTPRSSGAQPAASRLSGAPAAEAPRANSRAIGSAVQGQPDGRGNNETGLLPPNFKLPSAIDLIPRKAAQAGVRTFVGMSSSPPRVYGENEQGQPDGRGNNETGLLPPNFKLPSAIDLIPRKAAQPGVRTFVNTASSPPRVYGENEDSAASSPMRASDSHIPIRSSCPLQPLEGDGRCKIQSEPIVGTIGTITFASPLAIHADRSNIPLSARGTSWSQKLNTRKTWDGVELSPVRLSTPRWSGREIPLTPRDREISRSRWEKAKDLQTPLRRALCQRAYATLKEEFAEAETKNRSLLSLACVLRELDAALRA